MKGNSHSLVFLNLLAIVLVAAAPAIVRAELAEPPGAVDVTSGPAPDLAMQAVPVPRSAPRAHAARALSGKHAHHKPRPAAAAQNRADAAPRYQRLVAPPLSIWNLQSCSGTRCGVYNVTMIGVGF